MSQHGVTPDGPAEPLPGLGEPGPRPPADLERAIRRTLAELHRRGHVDEVDAGRLALAIELAQVITLKRASGRASTIGNDARVLMEILDSLVKEAGDVDTALAEAMAQWADVTGTT